MGCLLVKLLEIHACIRIPCTMYSVCFINLLIAWCQNENGYRNSTLKFTRLSDFIWIPLKWVMEPLFTTQIGCDEFLRFIYLFFFVTILWSWFVSYRIFFLFQWCRLLQSWWTERIENIQNTFFHHSYFSARRE